MADFAYVVDASLGAGTVFDPTKVDWVATSSSTAAALTKRRAREHW